MEDKTTKPSGGSDKNKELPVKNVSDKEIKDLARAYFGDDFNKLNPHFLLDGFSGIGELESSDPKYKAAVMDENTFADGNYVEKPTKSGKNKSMVESSSKENKKGRPKKTREPHEKDDASEEQSK